jgi:dinuclear metal center YbgI/SA1388 family protein
VSTYSPSLLNFGNSIFFSSRRDVKRILLTNDLTERVMQEAISRNSDLIISYHPPIFSALKRVTTKTWKERIVQKCLENRIALFSPHTSWDNAPNGINEWLARSFPDVQDCQPGPSGGKLVTVAALPLVEAIERIKRHTGVQDCRVGYAVNGSLDSPIKTVAICAGSGASVLRGVKADLYLTGEMLHHDVLDANHLGANVILLNHSNSERGFLKVFKEIFSRSLNDPSVEIAIAETDEDPLKTA